MAAPLTALALGSARKREVKAPLVRVRTVFQRGEAPEILEVEANLDPLEVVKAAGVGILIGGVALAAGWLIWDGLAAPGVFGPVQIFNGIKTVPWWQRQAERLGLRLENRQAGIPDLEKASKATSVDQIACDAARVFYSGLRDFERGFCRRNGLTREECLTAWRELQARCDL